ncbi:EAL domain-containing protein [Pseudarthrobacter sp. J75]|uniref:EAL domain-containing protein n=1 Tax=unclassified Pseudarthrobacter TaxID=2647000 RepID=UPI002E812EA1|nr:MULTISPECIES: EAL domain-containing protein [unclassified Pseudarthrobacter]MEE2522049.1 EAL domain-containing protein [Pseudarthrobacter sp. J47]MEE2528974.1 EAL domain-containing protein [Pseudarthrobacter sp. J75]
MTAESQDLAERCRDLERQLEEQAALLEEARAALIGAAADLPGAPTESLPSQDPHGSEVKEPGLAMIRRLRLQLAEELRQATHAGSALVLEYQPVITLADNSIEGVEALLRWDHPVHGRLAPDAILPLAEEAGLLPDVTAWVLRTAVGQLSAWQQQGLAGGTFTMRVNLAPSQLQSLQFADDVRALAAATGVRPQQLIFELTEKAIVTGNDLDRYSLAALRNLGIGVEIDDFGAGYSSISYLQRLPVDKVKVDRSLIAGLGVEKKQSAFVAAVLQLIRACGLDAVWEGVETAGQAAELRRLGCTSAQGFFFGRPQPPVALEPLLRAGFIKSDK